MPNFQGITKVIESYKKAPEYLKINSDKWAAAGFSYKSGSCLQKKTNQVQCHSCNTVISVQKENPIGDPFELHLTISPRCLYVKLLRKYIRNETANESPATVESIVKSYETAPNDMKPEIGRFAMSGLLYTGEGNGLECISCLHRFSSEAIVRGQKHDHDCKLTQIVKESNLIDAAGSQDLATKVSSFQNAPDELRKLSAQWALAGFHYSEILKSVYCRSCDFVVLKNGLSSNFFHTHISSSPECEYLKFLKKSGLLDVFTNNNDLSTNIESFEKAPQELKDQSKRMAVAGFRYIDENDTVKCNTCGLTGSAMDSIIWLRHRNRSNCNYVEMLKKHDVIDMVDQTLHAKMKSFDSAPDFLQESRIKYALAGFKYCQQGTSEYGLYCPSCDTVIFGLPSEGVYNPFLLHCRINDSCQYVNFVRDSGLLEVFRAVFERDDPNIDLVSFLLQLKVLQALSNN